ncbi:transglutaminase domain-containing protein [uncultured Methanobrevibacter sp.]|uniref:transglutaminase domain-containing protein n=1 Tax=uncultured Methanobrevibacter sp. TaxID=253161 RepID=UPI002636EFFD|nr:transglutaminase domain-containing protein [uncultured Methanobrevibacter sp.]
MIKKILFITFLVLLFSVSSVQASEVDGLNHTGDVNLQLDDAPLQIADESQIGDDEGQDTKNNTQLTSPTTKIYYSGNYQVTLKDSDNNKPLANKTVKISLNNKNYSVTTNSKGVASIKVKLNPGSYLATARFDGDDDFNAGNNLSGKVKVLTTIKASDVTKYYKGSKTYKATYLDSKGNVLKNKNVAITVNGKKYTRKTNSKGVVNLAVNLKPGTYKVATTNPSTGEKSTVNFKILSTVSSSNLKKVKGDSKKFTAKFFRSDGKALVKQQVRVKISDKTYTYTTNSKGQLNLPFNTFKQGTYKVTCYSPDGLSKTSTVQIFNKASTKLTSATYTFLTNDTKVVKIKFSTALDDNSKAGKTLKIFVDDKAYSKKTDSNGEVNLKLPALKPGLHYIVCEYPESKFFKYSCIIKDLTILDTSDAEFTVDGTTSFGNFAGTPFGVVLTAGDVPLIKRTVTFNVNGKTYTNTTNDFGFTSIPINLDAGNYVVTYKSAGNSKIKDASGVSVITVFERINTVITGNYKASYNDIMQSFNVYLKDSNGTPISGEMVELVIGNETYSEKTDSKGYALIKTSVPVGKYAISVVFRGNNIYNSSSKSGSTTVTLSQYGDGINEKNAVPSSAYLRATRNCQVNNAKIKSLAKSLTKGLTSDLDKAKALFNYVQLYIEYEYYFDTDKGAVETLTSHKGNGVDHAHLLIALYRAAGLQARYVHGNCYVYMEGRTYGHVWTQVLVDNTWICADSSDLMNKFGYITSWDTSNYRILNKYSELPF